MNYPAYICHGFSSDILYIDVSYGMIILYVSQNGIEKPTDKELRLLKESDTDYCEYLTREMEKSLNIKMEIIYTTQFKPRNYYTIYLFTYMGKQVYILEHYNGASATYNFQVYEKLIDAISAIYPSSYIV
jgi:hypothetical protein